MSTTTPLGFIVPVDADAPNGPVQIGGNAEKADELLQAGGVAKSIWVPGEVTRASATLGAFSTPLAVELPRLKENQLVLIRFFGKVKSSIESTSGAGGSLALKVGASAAATKTLYALNGSINVPANTLKEIFSTKENIGLANTATGRGFLTGGNSIDSMWFIATAEVKPCVVELQGASSSGTITAKEVWLQADIHG